MSRQFTDLQLERHLCGDLSSEELAEFDSTASAEDKARLSVLREEGAAFLEEVGVHKQAVAIRQKVQTKPRGFMMLAPFLVFASAAAGLFLYLSRPGSTSEAPEFQTKGSDLRFRVHLATAAGSRALMPGDTVPQNAQLRFEVVHDKPGFVAIVGVDSANVASVYYPITGTSLSAPYNPAQSELPGAIELDDTPGTERFYAVFSVTPFDAQVFGQQILDNAVLASDLQVVVVPVVKSE